MATHPMSATVSIVPALPEVPFGSCAMVCFSPRHALTSYLLGAGEPQAASVRTAPAASAAASVPLITPPGVPALTCCLLAGYPPQQPWGEEEQPGDRQDSRHHEVPGSRGSQAGRGVPQLLIHRVDRVAHVR